MFKSFISELKKAPKETPVFNPWYDTDPDNDLNQNAPKIRRTQLAQYLKERQQAKYLLLGEAIGYQGGHFSGMAMTSERILLGGLKHKGIDPGQVFTNLKPQRTSKPSIKPNGFSEPTATIAWGFIIDSGLDPRNFVIWNTFPWHPYHQAKGMLSNRTPTAAELEQGIPHLKKLITLMKFKKIIAVGEKAYQILSEIGIECCKVRHPANGGAGKFREQMALLVARNT